MSIIDANTHSFLQQTPNLDIYWHAKFFILAKFQAKNLTLTSSNGLKFNVRSYKITPNN